MPIIPDEAWPAWFNPAVIPAGFPDRIEEAVGAWEVLLPSIQAAVDQATAVWAERNACDLPDDVDEIYQALGLQKLLDLLMIFHDISDIDGILGGGSISLEVPDGHLAD